VSDEDIRHAYANPIWVFDLDEGFTMIIGVVEGVAAPVVVHARKAREKFLR
jgi:hypothetical protein